MAANTPQPLGTYLLLAIVGALIAGLSAWQSGFLGTYTPILFFTAFIAALAELVNLWQNGAPGTPVPWKTLAAFILGAAIYAGTYLTHYTTWNEAVGVSAALLFLTYLWSELGGGTPPAASPSGSSKPAS
ncbi:MAG TPA: hypothetical protein VGG32_00990 [Thermoplasmata archaeon]|jgi:hypothetical protein